MKSDLSRTVGVALAGVLAGVLPLVGQEAPGGPARAGERNVIYVQRSGPMPAEGASDFYLFTDGEGGAPVVPPPPGPAFGSAISFVSPFGSFGGETVTGAPYSAEAVTEIEQRLADGNRIVRKTTATLYRDSAGRTRRDQTLGAIGTSVVGGIVVGEPPQISSIYDPVEGVRYMIHHEHKIAHKVPASPIAGRLAQRVSQTFSATVRGGGVIHAGVAPAAAGVAVAGSGDGSSPGEPAGQVFNVPVPPPSAGVNWTARVPGPEPSGDSRAESLGTQTVEGVEAEGMRSITTIPAGAIGNDFAIEIVTERWYSPELKTVVLSLHKDPRMGETTYRLSNIQRTEPAASLFAIPDGYELIEPRVPSAAAHPAP